MPEKPIRTLAQTRWWVEMGEKNGKTKFPPAPELRNVRN